MAVSMLQAGFAWLAVY